GGEYIPRRVLVLIPDCAARLARHVPHHAITPRLLGLGPALVTRQRRAGRVDCLKACATLPCLMLELGAELVQARALPLRTCPRVQRRIGAIVAFFGPRHLRKVEVFDPDHRVPLSERQRRKPVYLLAPQQQLPPQVVAPCRQVNVAVIPAAPILPLPPFLHTATQLGRQTLKPRSAYRIAQRGHV